jgi:hypothetical protein
MPPFFPKKTSLSGLNIDIEIIDRQKNLIARGTFGIAGLFRLLGLDKNNKIRYYFYQP